MTDKFSEEIEDEKTKKLGIMVLSIFMIILLISYFILYEGINHGIISGLIGSSNIKEDIIELKDLTINFQQGIQKEMIKHYLENEGNETKFCLMGEKIKNNIQITSIYYPKIISQTFQQVRTEQCPKGTLISVHSHPNRQCLPSIQDLKTRDLLKKQNKDLLTAIMCEENRLYFY